MRCAACNVLLETWESGWNQKLQKFNDTCEECTGIYLESAFDLELVDNSETKIKFNRYPHGKN